MSFGYEKEGSMPDIILADMQISNATCSCVINAPVEKVDLARWLKAGRSFLTNHKNHNLSMANS